MVSPNAFAANPTGGGTGESVGCSGYVLGFPQWSTGLPCGPDGSPRPTKLNDMWIIVLNITQMIIMAAGYAGVGFFIWGGFTYIMSQGDPSKITEAKNTLLNVVIGLIIVMGSIAIINFVKTSLVG